MIWLLGVYMWLFVHRPFEVWPWLGDLQVERVYMILMIGYWAFQPNKGWLPNRLHVAIVAFTVAMTAAWVASPFMGSKGCPEIVEDYFKYLVFYVLVVTSVRDEEGLRKLVLLYLLAVALYTGHSFLEFLNGRCQWRMGVRRMIGVNETIGDANGFAANLVYALPLTVPFWLTRSPQWLRAALVGFTIMACGCVLLTGSRAGLLSLGVCTLLCLAATGRVKTAAALLVVGLLAAPVVWSCLPEDLQMRYETIIDPSVGPKNAEESASGRLAGLVLGFEAWQQSPLLGHGPGGFKYVTGREGGAHNLYGQTLSETGGAGSGRPGGDGALLLAQRPRGTALPPRQPGPAADVRVSRRARRRPVRDPAFVPRHGRAHPVPLLLGLVRGVPGGRAALRPSPRPRGCHGAGVALGPVLPQTA